MGPVTRGTRPVSNRPTSFALVGMYLGWKAVAGLLLVFTAGLDTSPGRVPTGVALLTAVFAAVAAEALWFCRPWCVRASIGYFAVAILAPHAASALAGDLVPVEAMFSIITSSILAAIPLLYVTNRASRLFSAHPAGIPIAVPRP
jgi:hypothetical protein